MNEVTEAHLREFDGYVIKWQRILSLMDWRIERGTKRSKSMAEVDFNDDARLATYLVGKDFGASEVNAITLETLAVHELSHILLHDLHLNWTDSNEHRVVNLLEKILMERI